MKLLFKTIGTSGNTELKESLSFIDADLKLSSLLPDIKSATFEIIEIIGQEIYDLAVTAYEKSDMSTDEKDLVNAIRYPIAIQAYRLFAPTGDIAHTNNGRKMRLDENEKLPFEWMLDRDNKSMEIRYYRATDELLKFLDRTEISALKDKWKESESFKLSRELFVFSTAEFNRVFPIESRLLYIKLIPGLKNCEDYIIKSLVGTTKIKALKSAIQSSEDIDDETDLELIRLIKEASVFHALAWSMPRYSVNLYPEGVLQHYTSDKTTTKAARPTLKSEPTEARLAFEADSQKALTAIQKLLEPPPTDETTKSKIIPDQIYGDVYFST